MGYLYLVLMRRIDAAYCCECRAFCGLCVRHTHSGEPCKTAEPIEMPFGAGSCVSKDARVCALNVGGPDWHNLANTIKRSARGSDAALKGKGYPFSIAERRVPELIPVLGSQPAGDVSYKSGGRLPLLFARPAVTLATLEMVATNFAVWSTETRCMGVNSLPKTVTRHRRGCDLSPGPILRLSPAR